MGSAPISNRDRVDLLRLIASNEQHADPAGQARETRRLKAHGITRTPDIEYRTDRRAAAWRERRNQWALGGDFDGLAAATG